MEGRRERGEREKGKVQIGKRAAPRGLNNKSSFDGDLVAVSKSGNSSVDGGGILYHIKLQLIHLVPGSC